MIEKIKKNINVRDLRRKEVCNICVCFGTLLRQEPDETLSLIKDANVESEWEWNTYFESRYFILIQFRCVCLPPCPHVKREAGMVFFFICFHHKSPYKG